MEGWLKLEGEGWGVRGVGGRGWLGVAFLAIP